MRITVCEMPDGTGAFEAAWEALREHVDAERSDLILLPPTPGSRTQPSSTGTSGGGRSTLTIRPGARGRARVEAGGGEGLRLNRAFSWTGHGSYERVHEEHYLPDEEDYTMRAGSTAVRKTLPPRPLATWPSDSSRAPRRGSPSGRGGTAPRTLA